MKIYFDYHGENLDKYTLEDIEFDFIQFKSGDKEYVFDVAGSLDICFEKSVISGRFKGEEIHDVSNDDALVENDKLKSLIANMDKSTFKIGLFEECNEPAWTKLTVQIVIENDVTDLELNREEAKAYTNS